MSYIAYSGTVYTTEAGTVQGDQQLANSSIRDDKGNEVSSPTPIVSRHAEGFENIPTPFTSNISGTYEIDPINGPVQILTATADVTLSIASPIPGITTGLTVILKQDATAGHTITVPDGSADTPIKWSQGVAPQPATTVGAEIWLYLVGAENLDWRGFVSGSGMA